MGVVTATGGAVSVGADTVSGGVRRRYTCTQRSLPDTTISSSPTDSEAAGAVDALPLPPPPPPPPAAAAAGGDENE